jgi:hypothetical protein
LSRQLNYLLVWPPGNPIKLGDAGIFRDINFTVQSNVRAFSVKIAEERVSNTETVVYHSEGVAVKPSPDGEGVRVMFDRPDAILLGAEGLQHRQAVGDSKGFLQLISELAARGAWDPRWSMVTEILEAGRVLLLVAGGHGAEAEIRGGTDIKQLLAGNSTPAVARQANMRLSFVASVNLPVFYRAVRARRTGLLSGADTGELTEIRQFSDASG